MSEGTDIQASPSRRHIIKRPRLTSLLDETTARCILLVAPAGYGKTTLAEEWQGDRGAASVRLTPATADDIAAFGAVIVPALQGESDRLMRIARGDATLVASAVVELILSTARECPGDQWLVLDDYHLVAPGSAVDDAVCAVYHQSHIRLLITSRRRPKWADTRELLYGRVCEIGARTLAMDTQEAGQVLSNRAPHEVPGLVALTRGWPAVIGLAAFAPSETAPFEQSLPRALFAFFAEELYAATSEDLQLALCQLSVMPTVTTSLAHLLLREADVVLAEATRLGFLAPEDDTTYQLHPLLRRFLETKFRQVPDGGMPAYVRRVVSTLIETGRSDDAFSAIERYGVHQEFLRLLESAPATLLRSGRIATLDHWVDYALRSEVRNAPIVAYVQAELLFRRGRHRSAELLATRASTELAAGHPAIPKALVRAGQAAYLDDRPADALKHHRAAKVAAATPEDTWDAVWGAFVAAILLELDESLSLLEELEALPLRSVDSMLRLSSARYQVAALFGDVNGAMTEIRDVSDLVEQATDPLNATSFLNILAYGSLLLGRYDEALAAAEEEVRYGDAHRLPFARAYALCTKARAEVGMRRFSAAEATICQAAMEADALDNVHCRMEVKVARAHLLLARGAAAEAVEATTGHWGRLPSNAEVGEYEAIHALALAVTGIVPRLISHFRPSNGQSK
ncbi:MAG: hypothetical protein QOF50_1546 [Gaiellaceae bacterium]|jgi:ATP/maltotriose-dependent transcriptional regulator MalT|nr:hypothetical protein [Gaiellaceae bacterium]